MYVVFHKMDIDVFQMVTYHLYIPYNMVRNWRLHVHFLSLRLNENIENTDAYLRAVGQKPSSKVSAKGL
jgi:hypothetical protein